MRIVFVIGPAFSGKSMYVNRNFLFAKNITIKKFADIAEVADSNEELEELARNAQEYCREALINSIQSAKEDDTIVLEHPLLHKDEREYFIQAIRKVTDAPIDCYLMSPDEETAKKLTIYQPSLLSIYHFDKQQLEEPTVEEGFNTVTIVPYEFID